MACKLFYLSKTNWKNVFVVVFSISALICICIYKLAEFNNLVGRWPITKALTANFAPIINTKVYNYTSYDAIKHLDPMDENVLNYLRLNHFVPPSKGEYALIGESLSEYLIKLREIFRGKMNGFFVECGANDGEFYSSTLDLEMNQNWSGLLVEANPPFAEKLLKRHRRAWFSDIALAPNNAISEIELVAAPKYNGDNNHWLQGQGKLNILDGVTGVEGLEVVSKVKCFPLTSLLAAMNVKHVDFFSLDVQGVEFNILRTLPFDDSLTIDIILTETVLIRVGRQPVLEFMKSKGYRILFENNNDVIFERIGRTAR